MNAFSSAENLVSMSVMTLPNVSRVLNGTPVLATDSDSMMRFRSLADTNDDSCEPALKCVSENSDRWLKIWDGDTARASQFQHSVNGRAASTAVPAKIAR